MERIESVQNPRIKEIKHLRGRKGREEQRRILVEGEKLAVEALDAGLRAFDALVEEGWQNAGLAPLVERLESLKVQVYEVPRRVIEAVSDTKTPQKICITAATPQEAGIDQIAKLNPLLVLNGVQDPGNVGTIWRTAEAAGFRGIMFDFASADIFSPKVQRAAMGSSFRLPALRTDNLADNLQRLKVDGYNIVVSALDGVEIYRAERVEFPLALVIGSEAHGVSAQVREVATHVLKLPMRGGVESLNAAIAAGILMYELTKEGKADLWMA